MVSRSDPQSSQSSEGKRRSSPTYRGHHHKANLGPACLCYSNRKAQSVVSICGFHICKFAYLLKFICKLQINTLSTFLVTHVDMCQVAKYLSCLMHSFPSV